MLKTTNIIKFLFYLKTIPTNGMKRYVTRDFINTQRTIMQCCRLTMLCRLQQKRYQYNLKYEHVRNSKANIN